jgi:AbrB family looped-hinge helix DNA binding protein
MVSSQEDAKRTYSARLDARGRFVLPVELRRQLELRRGDRLMFTVEEDGYVRVESAAHMARRLRGMFAGLEGSMADALIAERRAEAQAED